MEKDLELKNLLLNNFIEKNGNKDSIQEKITEQKTNLNLLKMDETLKNISEKAKSLELTNKAILSFQNSLDNSLIKKSQCEMDISKNSETIAVLKFYPVKYNAEKEILKQIKTDKNNLFSSYNTYLSYEKTAQNLNTLKDFFNKL